MKVSPFQTLLQKPTVVVKQGYLLHAVE